LTILPRASSRNFCGHHLRPSGRSFHREVEATLPPGGRSSRATFADDGIRTSTSRCVTGLRTSPTPTSSPTQKPAPHAEPVRQILVVLQDNDCWESNGGQKTPVDRQIASRVDIISHGSS
jgi:hypothetical protein